MGTGIRRGEVRYGQTGNLEDRSVMNYWQISSLKKLGLKIRKIFLAEQGIIFIMQRDVLVVKRKKILEH